MNLVLIILLPILGTLIPANKINLMLTISSIFKYSDIKIYFYIIVFSFELLTKQHL